MKSIGSANRFLRGLFLLGMVLAVFTGFGNMPLYKRYYVADLPGVAWAGDFFANLQVHLLTGAAILGIAVYFTFCYVQMRAGGMRLTRSGVLRAVLIGLLLVSGIVMVLKNFHFFAMTFPDLMILNFVHLSTAMLYLLVAVVCLIAGYRWIRTHP